MNHSSVVGPTLNISIYQPVLDLGESKMNLNRILMFLISGPVFCIVQEDMKACTFSPQLASHKTRIGRSLSPQRQGPVYEELYKEASAQRFSRTLVRGGEREGALM